MARGTISGLLAGVAVSAVGLGVAALVVDPVRMPGAEPPQATVDEGGAESAPQSAPAEAPEAAGEVPETTPETVPDPVPETGEGPAPDAPGEETDRGDETVQPTAQAPTAQAPTAQAPTAQEDPATGMAAPEPETAPTTPPAAEAEVAGETPPVVPPAAPSVPEAAPMVEPDPEPSLPPATGADPVADPGDDRLAAPRTPDTDTETDTDSAPADEDSAIIAAPESMPEPMPEPMPEATPQATPETGAPPVVSDRLPSIGAEPEPGADATAPPPQPSAAAPAVTERPAIERNAVPYEGDPALPRMSVLLLDEGETRNEVGDLAVLPFPLSVAVDASAPDAEAAVDFYRGVGAEVVLMVPLPPGATPTDVDVTFQVYEPLMRKAVAVMIPEEAGFQLLGAAAAQVATVLGEQGLGLVSYPQGLNTGHKTAVSEDVPAGLVFRDLDSQGQAPDVIRRFLDNVAFKARGDEGVIAIARVRPDSLQALLEWSLGNRAQTVNLAPVSAVLLE